MPCLFDLHSSDSARQGCGGERPTGKGRYAGKERPLREARPLRQVRLLLAPLVVAAHGLDTPAVLIEYCTAGDDRL